MSEEDKKNGRISRRQFLKRTAVAGAAAAAFGGGLAAKDSPVWAAAPKAPVKWDRETDVVVIGAGATGLPAAIVAREAGARVIVVEANFDIGGHAITSGGNIPLGGGTSAQKKAGIKDSPDLLFQDLTDWSIVQSNGFPDYRYNDREIIRAFADNSAATYEWLVAHDVAFIDRAPDNLGGISRQLCPAGDALGRHELAHGPDRQARRPDRPGYYFFGNRADASPGGSGEKGRRPDIVEPQDGGHLSAKFGCGQGARHHG